MNHIPSGTVVIANVLNSLENPRSVGKGRPCVVIERQGGQYLVVGLTTRPRYRNGEMRTRLPDPAALGLHGIGYLWGNRLTRVCALDVDKVIGRCTPEVADLIIAQTHLNGRQIQALSASVAHDLPLESAA